MACAATALPSARFCQGSDTGPAATSIIVRKTRIDRCDDESGRSSASSRRSTDSNSSPLKPLDEHVVHPAAAAVHGDADPGSGQQAGKGGAGELLRFNWS